MDKKLSFEVEKFNVIDDYSDDQLAIVEIYVCHDGNNLHDMPIDLSVLKQAKKTLKNKFLVAGYDGSDFEGHEVDEQIVGFFPESSEMRFEEKDGKTYLVAQAIMSKIYAKWAYDVFVEDENYRAVSMEITVLGIELDDTDGLEHITKFVFNGVTLLGESHMPACEGANASIIKFSKENALKVYGKRLKNSDKIKKDFVRDMELAEGSGKEESENMDKKEENVQVEEIKETVETKESDEAKEFEDEVKTDEDTYMETKTDDEDSDDKDSDDKDSDDKDSDDKDSDTEEMSVKENEEDSKDEEDKTEEKMSEEEDVPTEEKSFESLTAEQKYEVFRSAVRESLNGCGYLETFDEEYLYVYEYGEDYTYRYSYTLEGSNCTIDKASKTRVMRGGYVEFEENVDVATYEALQKENCELKEKLFAYETTEKDKSVEAILSEVVDVLPAERIAELREEAKNYSLNDLTVFGNEVKAAAFEAVSSQVKDNKYSFTRMSVNNDIEKKTSKYGW